MKSESEDRAPSAKSPSIEWVVYEDESEWQRAHAAASESPLAPGTEDRRGIFRAWREWLPILVVLMACVLFSGWWLWRRAKVGVEQVRTEIEGSLLVEEMNGTRVATETLTAHAIAGARVTQIRDLGTDWAVADVLVQPTAGGPSYRQTRVYRYQEGQGWTHQAASAEYWGSARQFKSKYFVFHYYAIDEQAVRFAAARLDALYPELYRLLMGEAAIGEEKSVFVDPALPPQRQLFENEQGEMTVTSPAAILLPTEMSAGDLLLQSLVLVLFKQFSDESFTRYRLVTHWARIHRALNLWFVWEHELPLAVWHGPMLQWIFATRQQLLPSATEAMPPFTRDICSYHQLWMQSPLEIGIPIICWRPYPGDGPVIDPIIVPAMEPVIAKPYTPIITQAYPQSLTSISIASLLYSPVTTNDPSRWQTLTLPEADSFTLVLAMAFDYIAATYGADRIPQLLAALPEHQSAKTLIPALFQISLAEFDEQWRTYLAQQVQIARK